MSSPRGVPLGPGQVARLGPAAVAVHHDRDVPRQPIGRDAAAAVPRSGAGSGGAGAAESGRVRVAPLSLGHVRDNSEVPTYRDEAVVLRTHKLGEADRIITMLSRGARQDPGGRQGRAPHLVEVRRPARAVLPRRPAVRRGPHPRRGHPGRVAGRLRRAADRRLPRLHGRPGDARDRRPAGGRGGRAGRSSSTCCSSARCGPSTRGTSDGPRPADDDLGLLPAAGPRRRRLRAVVRRLRPLRAGRPAPGLLPGRRRRGLRARAGRPARRGRPRQTLHLLGALLEGRWAATRDVAAARRRRRPAG